MIHEPADKWRWIPGYEDRYQCSRAGLIRAKRSYGWRLLKTTRHRDGYDKLNLTDAAGNRRTFHVHILIALTFIGPRPAGKLVDHKDVNHENHAAGNLRYLTPAESSLNRRKAGEGAATGEPCVYRHGRGGFFVRVNPKSGKKRLGRFMTIEEAKATVEKFRELQRRAAEVVCG